MSQGQHLISVSKQHGGTKNDNYNRYEPALWAPLIYFNYFNLSSLLVLSSSSPNLSHSPLSLSSYEDWAEIPQIARLNAYVSQSGLTKHTRLTASIVWKRGGGEADRGTLTHTITDKRATVRCSVNPLSHVWVGVLMYGTRSGWIREIQHYS